MDKSLKWPRFSTISVQTRCDALGIMVRYFFIENLTVFLPPRSSRNTIQTVIFSSWRFLRNEIISQLELGPPLWQQALGAFASLNLPINESVWGRHLVVHLKNSRRHDHLGHFPRFETFFWISKESWIANYFWVLNKSFLEKVILVIVFQIYNNFSIRIYF